MFYSLVTHRHLLLALSPLLVAFFVLNACRQNPDGKSEILEDRVRAFWEKRIAGEDLKAYAYEAYAKKGSMSTEAYVRARNPALRYKAYTVKEIEKDGDEATVKVNVAYNLAIPARGQLDLQTEIAERWVRLDGQWYRQEPKQDDPSPAQ